MAPYSFTNGGSGNDLLPICCQAIITELQIYQLNVGNTAVKLE